VFGVAVPAFTVKVEVIEPFAGGVTEVGDTVQVAFVGQPETTARLTALLNPFWEVTVTVEVPWLPCASVREVGLAEIEKSGLAPPFTTSVTVVEWLNEPLLAVPVIVSV
jgi:hypothetical protein